MSIEISWLVEDQIILWTSLDDLSVADLKAADAAAVSLMGESAAPLVHIIFDSRRMSDMPSLVEMANIKWTIPHESQNGWDIFIGLKNPIHKMIVSMMAGLFRARFRQAATFAEALEFLQSIDSSLPDLSPYKEQFTAALGQ